jgi:hypothetical protein
MHIMKNLVLIIPLLLIARFAVAQISTTEKKDSWKISLNKKTVLISSESNEMLNTKKIKSAEWNKNGSLEIIFHEADTGFWRRSFQFEDENGNQLFSRDSTTKAKIPLSILRKLFTGKKEVRIYMAVSPRNPAIAVRMQRVHLCTLKL